MSTATNIVNFNDPAHGAAALSLLEALLLVLLERGVLSGDELDDAFLAAIAAHRREDGVARDAKHDAAARLIERLRMHGNAVRLDG